MANRVMRTMLVYCMSLEKNPGEGGVSSVFAWILRLGVVDRLGLLLE